MQAVLAEIVELPLQRHFLKSNPVQTEPWRSIMLRNSPGQAAAGAPVFLAQGAADVTVSPTLTEQFMAGLCQRGTPARLVILPGVDHHFVGSCGCVRHGSLDGRSFRWCGASQRLQALSGQLESTGWKTHGRGYAIRGREAKRLEEFASVL
jgi:hypothetical protein